MNALHLDNMTRNAHAELRLITTCPKPISDPRFVHCVTLRARLEFLMPIVRPR